MNFKTLVIKLAGPLLNYNKNIMETIKSSSLKTNEAVISDLKILLSLVNDGKEGYEHAAETTENLALKEVFLQMEGERIVYGSELKEHISVHGGEADNENGGILGGLHRTWITVKQALTSKEDLAILDAVITGEKAAIAKYNEYIADYADHADHLTLLKEQRDGIQVALGEIEALKLLVK